MQQRARQIPSASAKQIRELACEFLRLLQLDQPQMLIGLIYASVERLLPIAEPALHFSKSLRF